MVTFRGIASLALGTALVAGSVALATSPAYAAADVAFTPTTNLVPGSSLTSVVVSKTTGYLCEESDGVQSQNGQSVEFGLDFFDSVDNVWDPSDTWLGYTYDPVDQTYSTGDTSSDSFTVEMPVLNRHNPANYIVARGYCYDTYGDWGIGHGDGVAITYSDLTFPTPNASHGQTVSAHIVDGTTGGEFCAVQGYGLDEPYSVGLEFYSSYDAWVNDEDPVIMLPETWSQEGPGLGSFTANAFAAGVDVPFTIPSNLPVGDYMVYAFCIAGDGTTAGGTTMGLQPFSVTASLPDTGLATGAFWGGFGSAAGLIVVGVSLWLVRRHRTSS